jgi:hypothetical protein
VAELYSPPAQDIYVVEFVRHARDLGVSVIVRANCEFAARLEAWRLFPEYKRLASLTLVHLLDYAEIDWQTGRCFVIKRQKRLPIPVLILDEPTKRPLNTKREDGAHFSRDDFGRPLAKFAFGPGI